MCANYNRITTLIFEYEVKNERFLSKIVCNITNKINYLVTDIIYTDDF